MYKDFIHIFVLSCNKATYLVEKQLHGKLNFVERLQLRIHLSLCSYCNDYTIKTELLDKLMRASVSDNNSSSIFSTLEVDDFKQKVSEKLFTERDKTFD